jgi:hypothetical protein
MVLGEPAPARTVLDRIAAVGDPIVEDRSRRAFGERGSETRDPFRRDEIEERRRGPRSTGSASVLSAPDARSARRHSTWTRRPLITMTNGCEAAQIGARAAGEIDDLDTILLCLVLSQQAAH